MPEPLPLPKSAPSDKIEDFEGDVLFIGVYKDDFEEKDDVISIKNDQLKSFNEMADGIITEILDKGDFKGDIGESDIKRIGI